jgi:putative solute:sodium symporter small subunit
MTETDTHTDSGDESLVSDGGTTQAAQEHRNTDYLDREVNILKPSTAFMRDHLRVVWAGFIAWALIVFGPVTATAVAPEAMQATIPGLGFPLHYFLVAFGAPTGALVLAAIYARQRDKLDRKYGIDHSTAATDADEAAGETAVADGGVEE